MKLVSWNINGVRSAERQGFLEWFEDYQPDVLCLQEVKAFPEQLSHELEHPLGYHSVWHPARRGGYSGVATISRRPPLNVQMGLGVKAFDREGRVLLTEYPGFTVINAYFPNSRHDHSRLGYKLRFCRAIRRLCDRIRKDGGHVVLCGDYNIAHTEIDLRNPKQNRKNPGFLPEERAWMDTFLSRCYADPFRLQHPGEEGLYTWWTYRFGARERNIGWRIDYHCVNREFMDRVERADHLREVYGSDHCPVVLEVRD
ncbi:MAG TPA: exodeoxyribonuclease III [Acidobacteriota bacterium]|nr:exodeoxyribonuclease III [Acidobacteriota bacterium]